MRSTRSGPQAGTKRKISHNCEEGCGNVYGHKQQLSNPNNYKDLQALLERPSQEPIGWALGGLFGAVLLIIGYIMYRKRQADLAPLKGIINKKGLES